MSCVVLSQNGRQMIQEMLNIGFIDEEHIQALNKIGTTSDPKLSNIKKPLIARLVKVMSDIHLVDTQLINALLGNVNKLQWELSKQQQATLHWKAAAQKAVAQRQQAVQQQSVDQQGAAGQPQVEVENQGEAQGTAQKAVTGLIVNQAPLSSEVDKTAGSKNKDGVGKRSENVKRQTCIFFRKGQCQFGPLGHNKTGTCQFEHPQCCPSFELYGWTTRMGCKKSKKCRYLHRDICKKVARFQKCNDEGCHRLHPRGILRLMERGEKENGQKFRNKSRDGLRQSNIEQMIVNLVKGVYGMDTYQKCSSYSKGLSRVEGKDRTYNFDAPINSTYSIWK